MGDNNRAMNATAAAALALVAPSGLPTMPLACITGKPPHAYPFADRNAERATWNVPEYVEAVRASAAVDEAVTARRAYSLLAFGGYTYNEVPDATPFVRALFLALFRSSSEVRHAYVCNDAEDLQRDEPVYRVRTNPDVSDSVVCHVSISGMAHPTAATKPDEYDAVHGFNRLQADPAAYVAFLLWDEANGGPESISAANVATLTRAQRVRVVWNGGGSETWAFDHPRGVWVCDSVAGYAQPSFLPARHMPGYVGHAAVVAIAPKGWDTVGA